MCIAPTDRARRERLLRYCARPPFALERRREVDGEHLLYASTKPGPGGSGPLRLTPPELIDRLAALDGEAVIRRTIKDLAEELDPAMFWQIHRSTLVNVNAIAGVTRDFRGHLSVRLRHRKETLPVSEPYMHLFKQM